MDRLLMVGRQHLYLSREEAYSSANLRRFADAFVSMRSDSSGYCESFLSALGAREISSLDFSDYEGATLIHDLNYPVPEKWEESYDLVLDGGSLEHVFNFPTAVSSCMRMVKRGGHFVSITPSNNFNGHGFYQFSAELFFRVFSRENGFSLPLIAFAEMRRGGRIYSVDDPAKLRSRILFGGSGPMVLLIVARRDEVYPLFSSYPEQSDYVQVWRDSGPASKSEKRKLQKVRDLLPFAFVHQYDLWRIQQRRRPEALRGVHKVKTVSEAFRDCC